MTWVAEAIILAGALLCEAFFSGVETASYVVSRIRLKYKADGGGTRARRALKLISNHPAMVVTTLVGTNVAVYISGQAAFGLVSRFVEGRARAELYSALMLTPLVFVFAEVLSKWWFRRSADSWFPASARLLLTFRAAFAPAVWLLTGAAWGLRKMLPVRAEDKASLAGYIERAFSRQGIHEYIRGVAAAGGVVKPSQQHVLDIVLRRFRGEVAAVIQGIASQAGVKPGATVAEAVEAAARYDDTAVLVYAEDSGPVGVVYLYDITERAPEELITEHVREVPSCDSATPLEEVLEDLRSSRRSVAVVTGKAGKTVGTVTVTGIMEYLLHGQEPEGVEPARPDRAGA